MNKKNKWAVILIVSLIGAAIFASCGGKQAKPKEEAGADPITGEKYPQSVNIATLYGAPETAIQIVEGYFDELGIPTKVLFFESGRDVNNAFASGSIVAATFGSSPISLGIANDLGYEVVFFNNVIGIGEGLAVKQSSGISSFGDLKGKKLAAPFASTAHYSLLNALQLAGIDQGALTVLDLQPQDILAAWIRGDIDGAYVWSPELDELLKDGIRLTDSGQLAEQGAITATLTVVNKEFAKKYPSYVQKYVNSFVSSYNITVNEPARALSLIAQGLELDEEETNQLLIGFNSVSPQNQLTPRFLGKSGNPGALANTLKSTADFHVTQNNLDDAGAFTKYQSAVNPAFLENSLK